MMKFKFFLLAFFSCCFVLAAESAGTSSVPKLVRLARFELSKTQFKKTKIGGLSGAFFVGDSLYALSDDRGRVNEPRFYVFKVKMTSKKSSLQAEVVPDEVVFIKPDKDKKSSYLDGESFAFLNENAFLVSCEGDNNRKPRREPRLFEVDSRGNFLKSWTLPPGMLPEPTGMQKKGIGNNSGIEGLTVSADGKSVLAAVERPLVQDADPEESVVRFYEYDRNETNGPKAEYQYSLSPVGLFSGVSEILSWKGKKYFVLERGVRPEVGGQIHYQTALHLVDLSETEKNKKHSRLLRKAVIDVDLGDENFEAMAWGPAWGEYDRTLWILNDNNFTKLEKSMVLIFGVKDVGGVVQ